VGAKPAAVVQCSSRSHEMPHIGKRGAICQALSLTWNWGAAEQAVRYLWPAWCGQVMSGEDRPLGADESVEFEK
jgi:hypothetical protein